MYETILVDKKNGIATITINRPEVSNAFGPETYHEITRAVEECQADESVKVIIFTGTGKHFCAGGDIKDFKKKIVNKTYLAEGAALRTGLMVKAMRQCPKPIISAINGTAAGAGAGLALASDFRVMGPKSKLSIAFSNIGFSGDTSTSLSLMMMVGLAKTTELMALGEVINAEEAQRLNLATVVTETDEGVMDAAIALAEKLINRAGLAFIYQKMTYYEVFFKCMNEYAVLEDKYMHLTSMSHDHEEAVNAFLEKRKPEFTWK